MPDPYELLTEQVAKLVTAQDAVAKAQDQSALQEARKQLNATARWELIEEILDYIRELIANQKPDMAKTAYENLEAYRLAAHALAQWQRPDFSLVGLMEPASVPVYAVDHPDQRLARQQYAAVRAAVFASAEAADQWGSLLRSHPGDDTAFVPAQQPSSVSHGPGPRGKFYWHGRPADFSEATLRYRLCASLWDAAKNAPREDREQEDVLDELYPHEQDQPVGGLKDLVKPTNKVLMKAGIPLAIRIPGGKIWLEELPG